MLPYDLAMSMKSPRRMCSHLKVEFFERLLEDTKNCPKFVVLLRDPRDALVSFYQIHKVLKDFGDLTWDEFFELFKHKKLFCGDILEHQAGWKRYEAHPSVLLMNYEDLLDHGQREVRRLTAFLDLSPSDADITEILRRSSFQEMKARGQDFYFRDAIIYKESEPSVFRKGVKGDWRCYFSPRQSLFIGQRLREISN